MMTLFMMATTLMAINNHIANRKLKTGAKSLPTLVLLSILYH